MSESEDEVVSFVASEDDIRLSRLDISCQERSEIESLKTSLVSSLEGESIVETRSAPSSPHHALLSALTFEQTTSAPPSPTRLGSTFVPRTSRKI